MALRAKEISPQDIKATEKNRIQYSSKHIKHLPPGTITDFEWKDYCPVGFRLIQQLEDIDHDEYMHSVCNDETLRTLSSGKIGKMFLLSKDDRFLIKILRKSEIKVILEMLPKYYSHIQKYRSTLLSKIYGAHFIKPVGGVKTYFAVMSNILQSDVFMSKVYDLKGSPLGRTTKKIKVRDKTILKDTDLDFCFYVDPVARRRLIKQTKLDCELLEDEGIINYSLMLGVQIKSTCHGLIDGLSPVYDSFSTQECGSPKMNKKASSSSDSSSTMYTCTPSRDSVDSENSSVGSISSIPAAAVGDTAEFALPRTTVNDILFNSPSTKFGMKIGGRARRKRRGGEEGEEEWCEVMLYLGIIDTFQDYGVKKRIEHCYKAFQHDSKSISAVPPKFYSSRFLDFVSHIFHPDRPLSPSS